MMSLERRNLTQLNLGSVFTSGVGNSGGLLREIRCAIVSYVTKTYKELSLSCYPPIATSVFPLPGWCLREGVRVGCSGGVFSGFTEPLLFLRKGGAAEISLCFSCYGDVVESKQAR